MPTFSLLPVSTPFYLTVHKTIMVADAVFNQADLNKDGVIDQGEFHNFLGQSGAAGSWESSSSSFGAGAGWGASAGWGAGASSVEVGSAGVAVGGAYDASYGVAGGLIGGGVVDAGAASFESVSTGVSDASVVVAGGAAYDASAAAVSQVHYATDAQGLFQDPNPQIIRRANPAGVQTYTQNIRVRFLQPPPVPAPGPLIIKEVRPPQPPVPPPLRLRQVAPPLPTPPPLVLRERPPVPPPVIASQTVIRRLPGLPVPPRSVIIERLPAAPPKPRDIILERWVQYGPQPKRRTLVQRAAAPAPYPAPRNVIIQYEPAQVRVVRNFQRLGVTSYSPAAYVQSYGASLLDAGSLLAQARAAGVVEDISPPGAVGYVGYGLGAYGQESWSGSSGFVGGAGVVDAGFSYGGGYGYGGELGASSWESSSYTSGGAGFGYGGGYGGSWSSGYGADAAFASADTNFNGTLDRAEFSNFLSQNL